MSQLDDLREDAREELLADESDAYESARFDDPAERDATVAWLRANPSAEGVLALLALRREAPDAYATIPADTRARILAAAMRDRAALNDFGYIDEDGGYDREAGHALLELGDAAVEPLAEELDDTNPGQLERATRGIVLLVSGNGTGRNELADGLAHRQDVGGLVATSLPMGLTLAERYRPELTFLDLGLANVHAYDSIRVLSSLSSRAARRCRVIAGTSNVTDEIEKPALMAGAANVTLFPFTSHLFEGELDRMEERLGPRKAARR